MNRPPNPTTEATILLPTDVWLRGRGRRLVSAAAELQRCADPGPCQACGRR